MSTHQVLHLRRYLRCPPTMPQAAENRLRSRPRPPVRPPFSPNQFYQVGQARFEQSLLPGLLASSSISTSLSNGRENRLLTCDGRVQRGNPAYSPGNSNSRLGNG